MFDDRGQVRVGLAADPVLFDAGSAPDRATPEGPAGLADGIATVLVTGEVAFSGGHATESRPGKFLRRD